MITEGLSGHCSRPTLHNLVTVLCILLGFFGCAFQVGSAAPTESIAAPASAAVVVYMLDGNGQPVAQPNACIQMGAVYSDTSLSLVLGNLDSRTGNILDADGNLVGYISTPFGDPPMESR